MHHLRGIHFSIIHVPTSLNVYQCLPRGYWLLFFFFFILDANNSIVEYNGISRKTIFSIDHDLTKQEMFLKGVLYATVTKSLVSIISINDHDPNSIDLSTKNKVHVSIVLLSGQKITYMQA